MAESSLSTLLAKYLKPGQVLDVGELHATSFVDPKRKLIFVENPKCACTSAKAFLLDLEGIKSIPFTLGLETGAKPVLQIHHRPNIPLPSIVTLSRTQPGWDDTLQDWFVFAFVRHPVERLFSAWRDKVFLVEPGFEKYHALLGKDQKYVEFAEFAEFVLHSENLDTCDRHWRRQTAVLASVAVLPFRYFDVREINRMESEITTHLRAVDPTFRGVVRLPRLNESYPLPFREFISRDLARRIENAYQSDMNAYGFQPVVGLGDKPVCTAGSLFNGWMSEIYERNRMISLQVSKHREFVQGVVAQNSVS